MQLFLMMFGCSFLGPVEFFGMSPEQEGPQRKSDPVGLLYFLCSIHATCITVFTRTGFGVEGIGVAGAFSLVLLGVFASASPVMAVWFFAWIIAVIVQRVITYRRISKGMVIHSRFAGRSLFLNISFFRKSKGRGAIRVAETDLAAWIESLKTQKEQPAIKPTAPKCPAQKPIFKHLKIS